MEGNTFIPSPKQIMIIEIVNCEDKQRSKAMKIVVGLPGVESVAVQGENRNQIAVIGHGVDSVSLINLLRKKMKQVKLVRVTQFDGYLSDDANVTGPEIQHHPTYYHRPSYQAVVPYDPEGYRPNNYDYHHSRPNYYDNYGYRSHEPDSCSIM